MEMFYGSLSTGAGGRLKNKSDIFKEFYLDSVIKKYKTTIVKDLKNLKIKLPSKNIKIMDIGTGRQSIALSQIYKSAKVDHFDISSIHVSALNKYIKKNELEKKISSTKTNIVNSKKIRKNYYNLIYIQGIIQHFSKPQIGLKKLLNSVKTGGYAWLYFYKSGAYGSFIKSLLRDFFHKSSVSKNIDPEYLKKKVKYFKKKLKYTEYYKFDTFIDAVFVPYAYHFDPRTIISAFDKSNFKIIKKKSCHVNKYGYAHSDSRIAFIISVKKVKKRDKKNKVKDFLFSSKYTKDQMKINYQKPIYYEIINAFENLKKISKNKKFSFEKKMSIVFYIFNKNFFLKNIDCKKKLIILKNTINKTINDEKKFNA